MSEDSSLKTNEDSSLATPASKDQQNASKLASEAAAEATKSSSTPSSSSSSSGIKSSSSSSSAKSSSSSPSSHQSSASSIHQTTASNGGAEQNNVNSSNGGQSAATQGEQTAPAPEAVKKFSEKSLQELADYYLNFKPSEIPDSGYVVSGIAGRFPNADNLNELWDNLYHGRDMVRGPDDKRWPLGKFRRLMNLLKTVTIDDL